MNIKGGEIKKFWILITIFTFTVVTGIIINIYNAKPLIEVAYNRMQGRLTELREEEQKRAGVEVIESNGGFESIKDGLVMLSVSLKVEGESSIRCTFYNSELDLTELRVFTLYEKNHIVEISSNSKGDSKLITYYNIDSLISEFLERFNGNPYKN